MMQSQEEAIGQLDRFIPISQDVQQEYISQTQNNINEQVHNLIYWLQQEIYSPEILPYQLSITLETPKTIQDLIKDQQEAIQGLKNTNMNNKNKQKEMQYLTVHEIEIERIKFIYHEYLRIRMKKLSEYAFYYYNERIDTNLSIQEREFMKKLVQLQYQFLHNNCLQYYQPKMRKIGVSLRDESNSQIESQTQGEKEKISVPQPNYHNFVFINVQTKRTFHLGGQPVIENDKVLVCYNDIKKLVPLRTVQLI